MRFDPDNPRFGGSARHKNPVEIQEFLERAPHFALNLVGSIVENGFLPYEPLIVRQHGETYTVIEGNRRLAAVKAILDDASGKYPDRVKEGLQKIPVLIFPHGSEETGEGLKRYLGVRHLFGFRDWPPVSKAMFLDQRITSKRNLGQVLKELNITRQEVSRYLIPYRLTKAAHTVFKRVDAEDFWALAESFGRKHIKAYIELDVDRRNMRIRSFNRAKLRHLAHFLYGSNRRVTDTRQLSALGKVLGSPRAAHALEHGASLEEASLYIASKEETIDLLIKQLVRTFDRMRKLRPGSEDSAKILSVINEFRARLKT